MKKYALLVLALFPCILMARVIKLDSIEKEIRALNFPEVKKILEKLATVKNITHSELNDVYSDLHDTAADVDDSIRFNRYFWKSWKDLAMTLMGGFGIAGGFGLAFLRPALVNKNKTLLPYAPLAGASIGAVSCFLFYKGISCSTQRSWIARAKEMQSLFNKKLSENNALALEK